MTRLRIECEALITGKQQKMSVLQSFKIQQDCKAIVLSKEQEEINSALSNVLGLETLSPLVVTDVVEDLYLSYTLIWYQFTYGDLKLFINDFSNDNVIGRTHFCKVYRGKMSKSLIDGPEEERVVTVKIWADLVHYPGISLNLLVTSSALRMR